MVGSDTSPGDVVGQDFGPYRIVRRLGVGGMAETFEAIRQGPSGFSRRVCLKFVRPALREDTASIQLFEREARLAAKLHHSNIVSVVDFGEIDGTLFMSLEFVDGVDLQTLLASRGKLSPEHIALLGHELALALEHAHEGPHGTEILHRDISPSNILVSRNGEIKLSDFGLAHIVSDGTPISTVKGKFPYMAPERLRDEPIDARSDLFALGVILFEALAGRRPFDGGHDPATIMLIIEGNHPPLGELAPDAPPGFCAIVESLIEADREQRPSNAGALVEQLEEFVPSPGARRKLAKMVLATPDYVSKSSSGTDASQSPVPSPTPSSPGPTGIRWARRDFTKVAAGLLLVVGGAGAYALWPRSGGETQPALSEADDGREPMEPLVGVQVAGPTDASIGSAGEEIAGSDAAVPTPVAKPPATARLTVLVSPWGDVWINGRARGAAPLKSVSLKPGRYRISAGQGNPSESRTVRLRPGQRMTIRFDLLQQFRTPPPP